MKRVRINDEDMTRVVDVIEETEMLDLVDVSEAIVQAMEFAGHDREAAHAIARYGVKRRDMILEEIGA